MEIITIAEIVFGGLAALGLAAGGLGFLVSQYKDGRNKDKKDDLDTENQLIVYMKNQVEGFKKIVEDQNKKIQLLTDQLNTVKGQLLEKDKLAENYLSILQNKNPEMKNFMQSVLASSQRTDDFIIKHSGDQNNLTEALKGILTFMAKVDKNLDTLTNDFKIEATVTKQP